MKYPVLLPFDSLLAGLDEYDAIIDVRSPSEFAEDHIPGAINCPVLSDAERIEVGTLDKQVDPFEARKLGACYAARHIAEHVTQYFQDKPREWKPLIYCWRGGNRSGSMAHVFARIGWPVAQLEGGYKNYRRAVISALQELPARYAYRVVCGPTGSGKSRLLQTLAAQGAQVLDLEHLARHKGSVLGGLPDAAQPSQKAFESAIWDHLRRFDAMRPVYVEAESKKVGNLRVPEELMQAMRSSPCVVLSLPASERIQLLMEEYEHFVIDPEDLAGKLDRLVSFYGHETIAGWKTLARTAQLKELTRLLLEHHYDPAYTRSIDRNFVQLANGEQIIMEKGSEEAFTAVALRLVEEESKIGVCDMSEAMP